jgi:hypothetical protein
VALPEDFTIPISSMAAPEVAATCSRLQSICSDTAIPSAAALVVIRGECVAARQGQSGADAGAGGGGDDAVLHLSLEAVCPSTTFQAIPVPQLPVIRSPLLRKVLLITDSESVLACAPEIGYLTMNSTRHVVLMKSNDPQAAVRPIIGIYVAAVTGVEDPTVWAGCLQFMKARVVRA